MQRALLLLAVACGAAAEPIFNFRCNKGAFYPTAVRRATVRDSI
jgi:hypothetical protein